MKLKGKTIIELTNVNTGEVEHYEDENIVTNALNTLYQPIGLFFKSTILAGTDMTPLCKKLVGGVLLFDTKIDENKETIYAPAEAKMIGCGVLEQSNTNGNTYRGDYNTNESGYTDGGILDPDELTQIKYVYDFNTSQANGTINCVCLTNDMAGYCGYGAKDEMIAAPKPTSTMSYEVSQAESDCYLKFTDIGNNITSNTLGKTAYIFMIDSEEDAVCYFRIDSATSISILKRQALLKKMSLLKNPNSGPLLYYAEKLSGISSGMLSTSYFAYNVDIEANKLYIVSSSANSVKANGSLHIIAVNLDDYSVSESTITNKTSEEIIFTNHYMPYIYNGYMYVRNNKSPYVWYKINISSDSDVTKITLPANVTKTTYSSSVPIISMNGRIYVDTKYNYDGSDQYFCFILNTNDNTTYVTETHFILGGNSRTGYDGVVPVKGRPMIYYCVIANTHSKSGRFRSLNNYLATINNLAQPITKTAEKTMKLTYILQKAESE